MKNPILPEFQDFLVSRSLVPEKNVSFYAHWVSKFLSFSNRNEDLGPDLKVEKFLNYLKSQKNCADWQIKQAEGSVVLIVPLPACRQAGTPPIPLWRDGALDGQIWRRFL